MNCPKILEEQIAQRIAQSTGEIFIRKDFADLADRVEAWVEREA